VSGAAWTARADGIQIAVRVTPRASREVLGRGTGAAGHFAARIAAPPVDGAANAALVSLVARTFGVAKGAVTVIAGETARLKRLRIAGDPAALAAVANTLYGMEP
jgi:uncharacterized protein (TIGR00251 family)